VRIRSSVLVFVLLCSVMALARAMVVSLLLLAFSLVIVAEKHSSADSKDDLPQIVGRILKGKDVGGMDLNDLVIYISISVASVFALLTSVYCYRHHKHSQIDPYKETLWRYTHSEPISVCTKPDANSSKAKQLILPSGVLCVVEEFQAKDGTKYLKLADGSGWVPEQMPDVGQIVAQIQVTSFADAIDGFQGPNKSWEFFLEWGWAAYDMTNAKLLSAAVGKSLDAVDSTADSRVRTVMDLVSMQQINMVSGKRRPIRRAESGSGANQV